MSVPQFNTATTQFEKRKFEKFQLVLESQHSLDQAIKGTRQYNDLEHILYMYTTFEFGAVKTQSISTPFNFSNLIFSKWYVQGFCYIEMKY
jgi:hypothetical protein